jgi:hypothetical protein
MEGTLRPFSHTKGPLCSNAGLLPLADCGEDSAPPTMGTLHIFSRQALCGALGTAACWLGGLEPHRELRAGPGQDLMPQGKLV